MLKLNTTETFYTKEQATKLVKELNADKEDDWTYSILEDPSGTSPWCKIEIHDEDGEFVARM